jgi:NADH pyrophosphatase NudC (nudix superfamily)
VRITGVEIPEDLRQAARTLRRSHSFRVVGFIACAAALQAGVAVLTFALLESQAVRAAINGAAGGALMITAFNLATASSKKSIHTFLRQHGYCACSDKAIPRGDGRVLACPECGSQWFQRDADPSAV